MKYLLLRRFLSSIALFAFLGLSLPAFPASTSIVIGFVGGHVKKDNSVHSEVQLATRLQADYASGVQVRMFENRDGAQARQEVLRLLDTNQDGTLSAGEKSDARISIYGHSWGASESVTLARALGEEGVPVSLIVLVDSVRKRGENNQTIPPNVAEAINFYQQDGLLHGLAEIRAADASRTQILGNFKMDYKNNTVDCGGYPWFARTFMKQHIEIESDPSVWGRVESLIRSKLPPLDRAN
jgi:hypothetical protein